MEKPVVDARFAIRRGAHRTQTLFVAKSFQKTTFFPKFASVEGEGNGTRALLLEFANKGGLFLDLWSALCDFTGL